MSSFAIGVMFSNGFTVIKTPSSPGNNTGEYLIQNSVGFQYFENGADLLTYNQVGNNNNGSGGTGGSTGSGTGGGSTTVINISYPSGLPFQAVAPSQAIGLVNVIGTSGSMVRLINNSASPQACVLLGWDNASTSTGKLLFAQQMDAQQVIDIQERCYNGITLQILGAPINADGGINVLYDTGSTTVVTGFPSIEIAASSSANQIIYAGPCNCPRIVNKSQSQQNCVFVGYDNASTTSGRILFTQQLGQGQSVPIGEKAYYGITVAILNGPSNTDYGVNVQYDPTP